MSLFLLPRGRAALQLIKRDIRLKQVLSFQPGQELKDYYQVDDVFKKLVDTWNIKLPGMNFISAGYLKGWRG